MYGALLILPTLYYIVWARHRYNPPEQDAQVVGRVGDFPQEKAEDVASEKAELRGNVVEPVKAE